MWPYASIVVFVFLLSFLDLLNIEKRVKLIAYWIVFTVLTLFLGTATIGPDLWTYESFYRITPPLPQLLSNFQQNTVKSLFEPLFLTWYGAFIWFGIGFKVFILVFTTVYLYVFFIALQKYTPHVLIGATVFLAYGYFYGFSAIRQMMAACIFFYALQYLREAKYLRYILWIFVASLFHISAIILVIFVFFNRIKVGSLAILSILTILTTLVLTGIFGKMARIILNTVPILPSAKVEQYLSEGSSLFGGVFLVWVSLIVACIAFKKVLMAKDPYFPLYFNILWIGLAVYIVSVGFGGFGRVILYFKLIYAVLIPLLVTSLKENSAKIGANLFLSLFVLVLFISSIRADAQFSHNNRYLPYHSWLFTLDHFYDLTDR